MLRQLRWMLVVMVVLGVVAPARSAFIAAAPQTITITNPAGAVASGEGTEYATLAWNDPWDMSDPLDVRQLDSPLCSGVPNHFTEVNPCAAGLWCGQAVDANPDLFLLHPGFAALHVGRDGHIHGIDANTYTQLTFRMYLSAVDANEPGFQVYWTNGTVEDIGATDSKYGQSRFYKTYPGWNIYTIDLSQETTSPFAGSLLWGGTLTGLRLDPGLLVAPGTQVYLDWVRLTPAASRTVAWSTSESGAATFELEATGSGQLDPVRMYDVPANQNYTVPRTVLASAHSYQLPVSLPAGNWSVHLSTAVSNAGPAGPWQVQAAPTVSIVAPSFTSGDDYAVQELGNAWDMNEASDVFSTANLASGPTFANGELTATSADTDPNNSCAPYWEDPNMTFLDDVYWDTYPPSPTSPPIDTAKYRYATFKLKLDGTPDISYGWIARIVWSNLLFANCGFTNDIPLHAGWNTVSVDLWDPTILDEAPGTCTFTWQSSAQRNQLRFDPLEVPVATTFHVDDFKLTSNSQAKAGQYFQIRYIPGPAASSVTFYYDTDTNPTNGRTLAAHYVAPAPGPLGPVSLYLPMVAKRYYNSPLDPAGMQTFDWDLSGVPAGTYYVSADTANTYATTTWYSEAPMVVLP